MSSVALPPKVSPTARLSVGRFWALVRRHWLFLLFLAAGSALRILVTIAYWPALEFLGDSYGYLGMEASLRPTGPPIGYSIFLRALSPVGTLGVVPIVQHVLGVGMGIALYVLLQQLGVRRPLAALATVPILLDAYQLDIEQFVLTETLTEVFVVAALVVLLWRRGMAAWRTAIVGALLAFAILTRSEIVLVPVVVAGYLLFRRRWRPLITFACGLAVPLVAYGLWWHAIYGNFDDTTYVGYTLYGRVAGFATCDYPLPAEEARLCPRQPVSLRTKNPDFYLFLKGSPLLQPGLGTYQQRNTLAEHFAEHVIEHQPLTYLVVVAGDTWHYFTPGRWMAPRTGTYDMRRWEFPNLHLDGNRDNLHVYFANIGFGYKPVTTRLDSSLMGPLRAYQSVAYTQGPILLASLLGAVVVGLGLFRRRARRREARWAAVVLGLSGLGVALFPSLVLGFSYRFGLFLLALLPPAGILAADIGLDALVRWWPRPSSLTGHDSAQPAGGRRPRRSAPDQAGEDLVVR